MPAAGSFRRKKAGIARVFQGRNPRAVYVNYRTAPETENAVMRSRILAAAIAGLAVAAALFAQPSKSVWDGVYTEEQAQRCHGPNLEGGEMAPGLADGAVKANWNGLTVGDSYERIRESMPPDLSGTGGPAASR